MGKRYIRIIPRLDIKGPNLVKGIHLEGLRVLGDPEFFTKYYYENGADEICYMDVVASLYGRNSLLEMISSVAKNTFIPITVGGGLRTLEDIKIVLNNGADKVSINTAAIRNPDLISKAANKFGSSTIVVSIEAIRQKNGNYLAYTDNGREETKKDVISWAKEAEARGAGEIIITSVDKEGTGEGFDVELVRSICNAVKVPVVAHGGAGNIEDIINLIKTTTVSGISIASIFHYDVVRKQNTLSVTKEEGNTRFLQEKRLYGKIKPLAMSDLITELRRIEVRCRSI